MLPDSCFRFASREQSRQVENRLKDMNLILSQGKQYFTHILRSFVKYCFHHMKIKFISSQRRVISSINSITTKHEDNIVFGM